MKAEITVTSMNNRNNIIVLLVIAAVINAAAVWAGQSSSDSAGEKMSFLDNSTIRLGVDLNLGGSITYLADARGDYIKIEYISWRKKPK